MQDKFAQIRKVKKLSIIFPVFNEVNTVKLVITKLLELKNKFEEIELIIIESNSNDGTRDIIRSFESEPLIEVLYEQRASGKGSAVKLGIEKCTGDVIVIFDADDEYDVNDLSSLTKEIESGSTSFCLGTRHKNSAKMRHFENKRILTFTVNLGHILFTKLFNFLFDSKLTDPFTMYKVFRVEVLNKIELKSNRFDIDWEILGKAIRVGSIPLEVEVSYKSRSFSQGKKVKLFKDPINWIYRAFIIRYGPL
jgi:glycosyltransferase involved in cell wall biosynthesis